MRALDTFTEPQLIVILWSVGLEIGEPADHKYLPAFNPFTAWERLALIRLHLGSLDRKLQSRVSAIATPRPGKDGDAMTGLLPPRFVRGITDKDDAETKKDRWSGETDKSFRICVIEGLPEPLTSTHMRKAIREGHDWRQFIPAPCHSYFESIKGPERWLAIP